MEETRGEKNFFFHFIFFCFSYYFQSVFLADRLLISQFFFYFSSFFFALAVFLEITNLLLRAPEGGINIFAGLEGKHNFAIGCKKEFKMERKAFNYPEGKGKSGF